MADRVSHAESQRHRLRRQGRELLVSVELACDLGALGSNLTVGILDDRARVLVTEVRHALPPRSSGRGPECASDSQQDPLLKALRQSRLGERNDEGVEATA